MASTAPIRIIKKPDTDRDGNGNTRDLQLNIWAMESRTAQFIARPTEQQIPEATYRKTELYNDGGGSLYMAIRAIFFDLPSGSFVEGSTINTALGMEKWIDENFLPRSILDSKYVLRIQHVDESGNTEDHTYDSMAMISLNMTESYPRVRAQAWDIRMVGGQFGSTTTTTP